MSFRQKILLFLILVKVSWFLLLFFHWSFWKLNLCPYLRIYIKIYFTQLLSLAKEIDFFDFACTPLFKLFRETELGGLD